MPIKSSSILKTLCYSDIFDYPLRIDELYKFLISSTHVIPAKAGIQKGETRSWIKSRMTKENMQKEIKRLMNLISVKNGLYCLKGREAIIAKRLDREKISREKLQFARSIIHKLSRIPTVQLIGISGSLAMYNADKNQDIDLFVITKQNALWITRVCVVLYLQCLGLLRKRNSKNLMNTVCVNMFASQEALTLPKEKQNLFTAHEVVQMQPIFSRENTYEAFIDANKWVKKYLPNAISCHSEERSDARIKERSWTSQDDKLLHFFLYPFEFLFKQLQLWYMRKHRTTELISDTLLAFHPNDYTHSILSVYEQKCKQYGV